jgi:hypothetical protein
MFSTKIKKYLLLICLTQHSLLKPHDFKMLQNKLQMNNIAAIAVLCITSGLILYKYKNYKSKNINVVPKEKQDKLEEQSPTKQYVTESENKYLVTVKLTSLYDNSLSELKAEII